MPDRRPLIIPLILLAILIYGTLGYHIVQPAYSLFDSLYMTVITITTVGYQEIKPLSTGGRVFNLSVITLGWLGIFFVARMTGQMLIEGEVVKLFGRRRLDKRLSSISDHYIVCGFGRVGRVVCEEFWRHKAPFVVIERDSNLIDGIRSKGYLYIEGDCTIDQTLLAAGLTRAKGLINAIPDVAEAVYTTLSARQHNPGLFIMARADSPNAEQMLKRAGADRVISPQVAAGTRMAMAALRPNVVDFMTVAALGDKSGLRIEEVRVPDGSRFIGQSFRDIDIRAKFGLNIIGVRKPDGQMLYNPTADYLISNGDTLIMVGENNQLFRIEELFGSSAQTGKRGQN